MNNPALERLRVRTVVGMQLFLAAALIALALTIQVQPTAQTWDWLGFMLAAAVPMLISLSMLIPSVRSQSAWVRAAGWFVILVGAGVILVRIARMAYGPLYYETDLSVFRPIHAFLPFVFMFAFALMRASNAIRFCWLLWFVVCLILLPGLYLSTGFDIERDGVSGLLLWLLVGNPVFLALMHSLPRYEEALARSESEKDEMRAQAELAAELSESKERFDLVVQSLQVGAWDRWLDRDDRRWWSPRFYELIGYSEQELPASDESLQRIIHPEDRDRAFNEAARQLDECGIMDVNFRLMTKHRGYRWFNSVSKALRDENGRTLRLAGAIADIHDRKVAEDGLHAAKHELTRMAYRDPLTDLHNRRYFNEQFSRELDRARRNQHPLSVLLLDLDHFKAYNDHYGHTAGDTCLVEVARRMISSVYRPTDTVARLGGEEFAVLLADTERGGAEQVAQRIRHALHESPMLHEKSPLGRVTASIGIATLDSAEQVTSVELMLGEADQALYRVKDQGRDGILHFQDLDASDPPST